MTELRQRGRDADLTLQQQPSEDKVTLASQTAYNRSAAMLTLAKQIASSGPLLSYHHYLVSSYKSQYYNVVFTLVSDVISVGPHHEMLKKHKPTKMRHVDIPPESNNLTWLVDASYVFSCVYRSFQS